MLRVGNTYNRTITTKHNKQKLTLIWSHSYNPWSGNKVVIFGDRYTMKQVQLWQRKLWRAVK